jgi:hypothetical protein
LELESPLEDRLGIGGASSKLPYAGTTQFAFKFLSRSKKSSKRSEHLFKDKDFAFELLPVEKGPSDRFRRKYGSSAVIRASTDNSNGTLGTLRTYAKQPFVLFGKVVNIYNAMRSRFDAYIGVSGFPKKGFQPVLCSNQRNVFWWRTQGFTFRGGEIHFTNADIIWIP